jgi:hypothetical protein
MSTPTPPSERTEDTVRARYRAWADANPRPRGVSAIGMPEVSDSTVRMAGTATGVLVGLLLLVLAVTAFVAARSWASIDRGGAMVAYNLTGIFLTIAGLGCIVATLNHVFGVLARPPAHH